MDASNLRSLLYLAGMDGEEQGRMALVIAGPVWVWFLVCISQGLEYTARQRTHHNDMERECLL